MPLTDTQRALVRGLLDRELARLQARPVVDPEFDSTTEECDEVRAALAALATPARHEYLVELFDPNDDYDPFSEVVEAGSVLEALEALKRDYDADEPTNRDAWPSADEGWDCRVFRLHPAAPESPVRRVELLGEGSVGTRSVTFIRRTA